MAGVDVSYFRSTNCPDTSYQVSSQLAFQFMGTEALNNCQDGGHGGILGFPIETILPTNCLDISYQGSSQMAFRFRRRIATYFFKMAAMVAILGFRSER